MAKVLVDTDTGQTLTNKSVTATGSGIANTLESRFAKEYWVTDFASGFGTANDATKFQTAINAVSALGGGTLNIPRGVFLLGTTVTIPSNITLRGQGMGVTTLRVTSTLGLTVPMVMGATGDTGSGIRIDSNIQLIGITFDGVGRTYPAWDVGTSAPATYGGGLSVSNSRGQFVRFYSAVNVTITYCEFMNHHSLGLALGGTQHATVAFCRFHGNGKVDDVAPALYISGGSFPSTSGTPTEDIKVVCNDFYDNLRSAVLFNPFGGGILANNTFRNNGESTVFSDGGSNMVMADNTIKGTTLTDIVSHGFEVNTSTNSIIVNNTIEDADGCGISCNGMVDGVIAGNVIKNCGQQPLYPGGPFNFAAGRAPGDPVTTTNRSAIKLAVSDDYSVTNAIVSGNIATDNQGSPTMTYGFALVRSGTPLLPATDLLVADNRFTGATTLAYDFVRQACTSTVKLRDTGWPSMQQVQVPASTGAVDYTVGYRPSYIKATAIQTSTTLIRTGIGMAMFDPSQAAEAERGHSWTVEETPAVESSNYSNILVQLVNATGTVQCSGNLTAWTDTGFTIDWTVVTVRPFVLFETLP